MKQSVALHRSASAESQYTCTYNPLLSVTLCTYTCRHDTAHALLLLLLLSLPLLLLQNNAGLWDPAAVAPSAAATITGQPLPSPGQLALPIWVWNGLHTHAPEAAALLAEAMDLLTSSASLDMHEVILPVDSKQQQQSLVEQRWRFARVVLLAAACSTLAVLKPDAAKDLPPVQPLRLGTFTQQQATPAAPAAGNQTVVAPTPAAALPAAAPGSNVALPAADVSAERQQSLQQQLLQQAAAITAAASSVAAGQPQQQQGGPPGALSLPEGSAADKASNDGAAGGASVPVTQQQQQQQQPAIAEDATLPEAAVATATPHGSPPVQGNIVQ